MSFFTINIIATVILAGAWLFLPARSDWKTVVGILTFIGIVLWVLQYFNYIHIG